MKSNAFLFPLMAVITLGACAPSTMAPKITDAAAIKEAQLQKEIAVKSEIERMQRLQNIARPILLANADLCGKKTAAYLGMHTQSKETTHKDFYDATARLYGVGEWPTITIVTKGAPADGRLKVGDMITHINGEQIKHGKAGHASIKKTMDKAQDGEVIHFGLLRNGIEQRASVKAKIACDSPVILQKNDKVNAYADGKAIYMTTGLMRFVDNDQELALIMGHELAHNSRRHIESKRGNAIVGGLLGAVVTVATGVDVTGLGSDLAAGVHSQGFEAEADYVGMYHTARAGYNVTKAAEFFRRLGAENPGAIHLAGTSHPSTAKRFLALENTIKEISEKRAKGLPLIPEERDPFEDQEQTPKGPNR